MKSLMEKLLLGSRYVTSSDLEALSNRKSLSKYLPYLIFRKYRVETNDETNAQEQIEVNEFLNSDATYGLCWECRPLTFMGEKALTSLFGMLKQNFPSGSVVQFNFFSDENLAGTIAGFEAGKQFSDELAARTAQETKKWLQLCSKGIPKMSGIPARHFRLLISIKSPEPLTYQLIDGARNNLKGAGLAPRPISPEDVKRTIGQLINGRVMEKTNIDNDRDIRDQIIDVDNAISFKNDRNYAEIGGRFACCLTPIDVPKSNDPLQTNALFGGYEGLADDTRQITVPFWYSLNVIIKDEKPQVKKKMSVLQWQKVGRSMSYKLDNAIKEFDAAIREVEQNKEKMFAFIPTMWVFGRSRREMERGAGDVEKLWSDQGFEMQRERLGKSALFIASLPFGLYNVENNITNIDRHFIATRQDIARFLPVQGDFIGAGKPTTIYFGRKGQVIGMNHFDERVNAYNFLVAGGTGSGKTFIMNDMLGAYSDSGYKLRMTDVGGGFEKLCAQKKGRYFDFRLATGSIPCINPLDFAYADVEDYEKGIQTALSLCGLMANSQSGAKMNEMQAQIMSEAVRYTMQEGNQIDGPEAVRQFLLNYKNKGMQKDLDIICREATILAYQMKDFGKGGSFEDIFCGKNGFDIKDEKMVVVELEHVRAIKPLYQVVTLQMMNAITQDLYLGDRSTQTVILFEEVLSFLNKNGQTDGSYYAGMVDEGYRRARKYRGSMGVVLQSMLDIKQLGEIGPVVNTQAVFKYYLESTAFDEAIKEKCIPNVTEGSFVNNLLNTVKSNRPNYSEIFLDAGPLGMGVVRLCVDAWRYGVNTSDGKDFKVYKDMLANGFTQEQAIEQISGLQQWL